MMQWSRIALLVPLIACSCDTLYDTLSFEHMWGGSSRGFEHPWHSVPDKLVGFAVLVPMFVVMLPAMCVEAAITGEFPAGAHERGVTVLPVKYAAMVAGYTAALPFYVVGLPLELLFHQEAGAAPSPAAPRADMIVR